MFEKFYVHGVNINSTFVESMLIKPFSRSVSVKLQNGSFYAYENVSMRACLRFIMDEAGSLGKFLNNVLKQDRVKCSSLYS